MCRSDLKYVATDIGSADSVDLISSELCEYSVVSRLLQLRHNFCLNAESGNWIGFYNEKPAETM